MKFNRHENPCLTEGILLFRFVRCVLWVVLRCVLCVVRWAFADISLTTGTSELPQILNRNGYGFAQTEAAGGGAVRRLGQQTEAVAVAGTVGNNYYREQLSNNLGNN